MTHARIFSASQLDRLFACPGSAVLGADAPRSSNEYSAWGTACHSLAADALQRGDSVYEQALGGTISADGFQFDIDEEMVAVARTHTDYVRDAAGHDGTVLVEQLVWFGRHLNVREDAFGTADALIVRGDELIVVDLKTGRGVAVDPADNAQLMAYALGCLEIAEAVADITRVRLVIVQPRAGGVKEHDLPVEDLLSWARDHAAPAAQRVMEAVGAFAEHHLNPGEHQCRFCPAKATCPALRAEVADTVIGFSPPASPDEFAIQPVLMPCEDSGADWLSACLSKVDLIEDWCKAVRVEAQRRLSDGEDVPGYKLVAGKRGARAWTDAASVEDLLRKKFRLTVEQAYDLKLISPTTAEKLVKASVLGPRQWERLQELVHQPSGKPHVAPVSDPRPAITSQVADEFPMAANQ